jgi:hypothetical protein
MIGLAKICHWGLKLAVTIQISGITMNDEPSRSRA